MCRGADHDDSVYVQKNSADQSMRNVCVACPTLGTNDNQCDTNEDLKEKTTTKWTKRRSNTIHQLTSRQQQSSRRFLLLKTR